jgi:predicted outer membrane repeat protein
MVTNTLDSGAGSLRAVVVAAHNGDTVVFDSSLEGKTITLTSGEILIKHSITITGFDDRNVTISGNNTSRIFELSSRTKPIVTMSGVTISNGYANGPNRGDGDGGAILNEGTLTCNKCTLSNNVAPGGSAIHNDGTLTVNNCTLQGNSGGSDTGAIVNNFSLTVTNSKFSDNSVDGIWNLGTVSVTGSIFSNNREGISNLGPATTTVIINGCTLSGNHFYAIDNFGSATLTVRNSTLSNNSSPVDGGGIYVNGGTVTVTGCTLTGNVAGAAGGSTSSGGAIYVRTGNVTISGCILTGNYAPNAGGAIYVGGGTVTLTNDKVAGNSTTGYGGGLYISPGTIVYLDSFTVANIIDNTDSSGLNGPTANIDGLYTLQ